MDNLKIINNSFTLVDQVEEKLLTYFKENDLHPGDPIPNELVLSEALGVGRSVLREALSRIRMMGLVESRTKRGMVLREPSLLSGLKKVVDPRILSDKILFDLLGFRIVLEIGLCDLIFNNITNKDIDELENIVSRGVVYSHGEYTPVSEYEFHTKLYNLSGNKTIIEFQEVIHPVSLFMKDKFRDYILPINIELEKAGKNVTHEDLFKFIKAADKEGFRHAMIKHFAPYDFINKK